MPDTRLQVLLDLTVQGIFMFGSDFKIVSPVSSECTRIFGKEILGLNAPELLFDKGPKADDFNQGLSLVFAGKTKPEVVFDLLESELLIAERRLRIDYRLVEGPLVVVVLTDITRERRFQEISRRDLERRFIVIKAVSHRRFFAAFMKEASALFEELSLLETTTPSGDELSVLEREIHTFKGNASFFDFTTTTAAAHLFETHIQEARILGESLKIKEMGIEVKKAYFGDIKLISEMLGQRWLAEADSVTIPKRDFRVIEAWIRKHHPQDSRLSRTLVRYRYEPFRELFVRIPALASDLAAKLGKRLHTLMIEGGDFPVIPDRYSHLVNVLVHLIRNALDHGIETPAEREAAGKDPAGLIRMLLKRTPGQDFITISDDGKGVDTAKVAKRARELKLIPENSPLGDAELMQVLFHQGFSTAQSVSDISGRGIGLAAVKKEIERMGGSIQIHSRQGRGTTFELSIPHRKKGAS